MFGFGETFTARGYRRSLVQSMVPEVVRRGRGLGQKRIVTVDCTGATVRVVVRRGVNSARGRWRWGDRAPSLRYVRRFGRVKSIKLSPLIWAST